MVGTIEFKHACCDACKDQNLSISNEKIYSYDDMYMTRNYVSCSHENVCKKILEEEQKVEDIGIHEELGILGQ